MKHFQLQGAYHYDLEVSPADGLLYVAHAERRQVWTH